jgi:hypothetical protein
MRIAPRLRHDFEFASRVDQDRPPLSDVACMLVRALLGEDNDPGTRFVKASALSRVVSRADLRAAR